MVDDSANLLPRKHAQGWMTLLALTLLVLGLFACLLVLAGTVAGAQVTGSTAQAAPVPPIPAPLPTRAYRRVPVYPAAIAPAPPPIPATSPAVEAANAEWQAQRAAVRDALEQSREALRQAALAQHRTRLAAVIFLAVFAFIAALMVIQVYMQARAWDADAGKAVSEVEAIAAQLTLLHAAREQARQALPGLLQEIGEQPLSYQEEGAAFTPRALAVIEDVDHLAYVGHGPLDFRDLSAPSDAAVYLNGLLLSAVAHLHRADAWTAFARLDQFFTHLARFPEAVDRRRIAQGYSYRALAAYQVMDLQDKDPSWLRKAERAQLDALSKQAFADISSAAAADPEWKHTHFVEAMLCGRFYPPSEDGSRSELAARGLRRAVSLYRGLIEERQYRGPARRNLVRALKQIAEQTGEKTDFSDFGYALNSFPTDEELADEALAARHPNSQDRFLWQWLLGDEELFANVERLNLAEYRAFWIRMLDTKVHLRNWRADLAELQHSKPAMREWSIQLLHSEPPISLASSMARRQERFDSPASGT